MDTENDTPSGAIRPVDPGRIGLGWGALFALPALAFALLLSLDERYPYWRYIAQSAALFAAPLMLVLAGVWWAMHRRAWQLVLGAAAPGLALLATLFAAFALWAWSSGSSLKPDSVTPFLVGWGVLAAWALVLALVVSTHVRLALRKGRVPAPTATHSIGAQHFVFRLATGLAAPLLLSVPVLLLLRYDIGLRDKANALLSQEIDKTKAQIGDVADYEKVRAGLLSRKLILATLEPHAAQTADVLHVFGRLPDGWQLRSLRTKGQRVSFTVRRAAAADDRALVDLLQHNGFRDIDITHPPGEDGLETVVATSTRMDAQ